MCFFGLSCLPGPRLCSATRTHCNAILPNLKDTGQQINKSTNQNWSANKNWSGIAFQTALNPSPGMARKARGRETEDDVILGQGSSGLCKVVSEWTFSYY